MQPNMKGIFFMDKYKKEKRDKGKKVTDRKFLPIGMLEKWNDGMAPFGQINACGGPASTNPL